jgi:hypothetical protein
VSDQDKTAAKPRSELKSTGYEIFVGILSVLSIVNLVLIVAFQDESLETVLWVMNALFSLIFPSISPTASSRRPPPLRTSSGTSAGPTCWPASRSLS